MTTIVMRNVPSFVGKLTGRTRAHVVLAVFALLFLPLALYAVVTIKDAAVHARMDESKHIIQASIAVLKNYAVAVQAGRATQEQGQSAAATVLNSMAFGEGGYVYAYEWASTPGRITLVFNKTRPDMHGEDRTDATSPDGVRYVEDGMLTARSGGGYIQYLWNAGGAAPYPRMKISYVAAFEPWGWYLGSGFFLDDIFKQFWDNVSFTLSLFAAILAIGSFLIDWLYSKVR